MSHHPRVVVTGPTGHQARCSDCDWRQDCDTATAAVWACWTHAKATNDGPIEQEEPG